MAKKSVRRKPTRITKTMRAKIARELKIDIKKLRQQLANEVEARITLREQHIEELERMRRQTAFIWVCADGRRLRPADMEEEHLRNTICYIQRRLTSMFGSVRFLAKTEYHVHALYHMLVEARRRGINV